MPNLNAVNSLCAILYSLKDEFQKGPNGTSFIPYKVVLEALRQWDDNKEWTHVSAPKFLKEELDCLCGRLFRPRDSSRRGYLISSTESLLRREKVDASNKVEPALSPVSSREKQLQARIDELESRIHTLRGSKFQMPTGRKTKLEGKSFCRVVIPDTHGCLVDKPAIATFLADLELIRPAEIVMLGDHLECGGFLAQHHTLGYVAQTEYTFDEDVAATNQLLDRIQTLCPNASIDYLEGNHERRIENWCVTQALKNAKDAEFLRRMYSADTVLGLEKRGIRWIRQGQYYDNLPIPATIQRGHCFFTHGSSTAKHAASEHVKKFGGNVVYGHTHRADSYVIRTVKAGIIGAWSPGCLCVLQPLWQHTNPTDWSHGYGLQLVSDDGSFLHINVPIIEGKSYLGPLFQAVA